MSSVGAKKTVDVKRAPRRSPSAEAQATPLAKGPATAGMSIAGFDVARATDLGKGYILVQVRKRRPGSAGPTALLVDHLPEIPGKDVEALLKELVERDVGEVTDTLQVPTFPPKVRELLANLPAENRAFMETLARQSMAARARQVENGALLTSADLCALRQITRQALSKAVKDGRVFWLDGPSGVQLYPSFFARPKSERIAFEKVSRALGNIPGGSKWQFFSTPKRSLGGITPVEALDKGNVEQVITAAVAFAER